MRWIRPLVLLIIGTASVAGCGDGQPVLSQVDAAAVILGQHVASGVYVGDGRLLTNWHVCTAALFDDSLTEADYPRLYDDGGPGASPYVEGVGLSGFYCVVPGSPAEDVDYRLSDVDSGGCIPVSDVSSRRLNFSRIRIEARPDKVLFADRTLDLCILSVEADGIPALDRRLQPVAIELDPVRVGQRVVVAGEQKDAGNDVGFEACAVVQATTLVRDPDPIAPSPLEVPSFGINCRKPEHGSSGSPVFDAETGRLLGLAWTGTAFDTDRQVIYVTAASEWNTYRVSRPRDQVSRLADLLDDLGVRGGRAR